jgi:hypothetical protein
MLELPKYENSLYKSSKDRLITTKCHDIVIISAKSSFEGPRFEFWSQRKATLTGVLWVPQFL